MQAKLCTSAQQSTGKTKQNKNKKIGKKKWFCFVPDAAGKDYDVVALFWAPSFVRLFKQHLLPVSVPVVPVQVTV